MEKSIKRDLEKVRFYILGADNNYGCKYYSVDELNKALFDFKHTNDSEYMSLGVEYIGKMFMFGVSSCDLFIKNKNNSRLSNDYKNFYTGKILEYTERAIEIISDILM